MLRPLTLLTLALATTGCASLRADKAAQVATGFAAHLLCNDVLVTGVDATTAFDERVRPLRGMAAVAWALSPQVDLPRREVAVTLAGGFESRSRWQKGQGCVTLPAADMAGQAVIAAPQWPSPPDPYAGQQPQPGPSLQAALDGAIPGPGQPAPHGTKALLVLHQGRLVAERYVAGYGPETPVLGFSATKSVTAALLGVLAQQGRLDLQAPAPIAEWQGDGDPRRAITVEQLLRQTSGLALPQTNSGFDLTSQIMYTAPDKAAAAAAAPLQQAPGTAWYYSDGHFMLLARVLRDATGGRTDTLLRFAHEQLFAPLGMRHVTLDVDAAGTPLLSSHLLASARDWSRLGQLWLDDGVVDGRRILPAGWVAMTATPTLDTGYGAGWWTNRRPGLVPAWGKPWGLPSAPADTVYARGFMGNAVVVVPSRRVVVVRLAVAPAFGDDVEETDRIVATVLAALP